MINTKKNYYLVIILLGILLFSYQISYAACPATPSAGEPSSQGVGTGGPTTGMETGGPSPGVNVAINEDTTPSEEPPIITAENDITCDGVDDDGDGAIDEDYVVIQSCGVGACKTNSVASKCLGGQEIPCIPGESAADDQTCNGEDDDCDGAVDEDYVAKDTTCGQGACVAAGQETCEGGSLVDSCEPGEPTGDDTDCNNIDENCNGTADEGYVATDTTCGLGVCVAAGQETCEAGSLVDTCKPGEPTGDDTDCNNIDENCDGAVDEGYMDATCGVGACNTNNIPGYCLSGVKYSCMEGLPAADDTTLNGIDDDCDGTVDEDAVASAGDTGGDGEDCTGNTEEFNGNCVPKCGRGYSRDASGNCVFDPARDIADRGGPTCMSNAGCPENHLCVNYKCMPSDIYDELDEQVRDRQGDGPERGPDSGAAGGGEPIPTGDYGKSECSYDEDCSDDKVCENGRCVDSDYPPYPPPHHRGDRHGEDVEDFVDDFIKDRDRGRGGRGRDRGGRDRGRSQPETSGGGDGGSQSAALPKCSSGKGKCCSPAQESGGSSTEKPYWALFAFPAGECANYVKVQFSGKEGKITPEEWMQRAKSQYGSGIGCLVTKGTKSQVDAKADGICSESPSQTTGEDCASLKSWWIKAKCDEWLIKNPNDPVFSTSSIGAAYSACKRAQPRKEQCEQNGQW